MEGKLDNMQVIRFSVIMPKKQKERDDHAKKTNKKGSVFQQH